MPALRQLILLFCCAFAAPAALGQITDLTTWDFYRDPSDPGVNAAMTGSSAPNLAQLNFIDDVNIPAAYDIGYSSINANTVGSATTGHYFSAAENFSVSLEFDITLTNPYGFVGLGLGIGEDRAGVNSAGIGLGLASSFLGTLTQFQGAATNNDSPIFRDLDTPVAPFITGSTYSGTLSIDYDATTGDITVGAAGQSGSSTTTFTAAELPNWSGDDLLVSFFLRSDNLSITEPYEGTFGPWTGESAEADFLNLTVMQGTPTAVPEPTSLALLGLGLLGFSRRRRQS